MIGDVDLKELIPKNKFDEEGIEKLSKLTFEEIHPIVPELLEWLQDMNWPVARPIAEILFPFVDKITDDLIKILRGDDSLWKYWILVVLLKNTNNPRLLKEIDRLARFPTKNEIENEVDVEAGLILNGSAGK
ncbi:DUF5071 domain-containing protein [Mucilaginibacter auburnensis]|uniref:Uncharacterized protein DUF5071 n=1 Tax=Mucilaginibacter auburnensis TaxID=1457233 RepID=A0A2H9VLE3_9SPHI|nr:DUF5071 domain-containing protein [Mucilaginibacter auburnensis]PJJ79143.1 uncharacterized protein DUF5071 [Mucilaginibacter auburnensis]